ncbi:MAG: SNF2-related protein [Halofilum sp. (in: g-proteobacteria)]|nr:SNF2-related protein [Halofilum sp. (in: g-proteobacteria)]
MATNDGDEATPPATPDLFEQPAAARGASVPRPWPDATRFPLNVDGGSVGRVVLADLAAAESPLVVTAYTALDYLIEHLPGLDTSGPVRLLLGTEPSVSERVSARARRPDFPAEVRAYWLARGVSLRLSARVIAFIEALRAGRIEARYLEQRDGRRVHAKIYVGGGAATIGSSNFSRSGLSFQHEANARFTAARERKRHGELVDVAENYWALGTDYTAELIALAERLLRAVDWREALARACAELLEGDWARGFLQGQALPGTGLWPHQRQGIAQALYILDRQGSVLVADATGSGKTRLGSWLVRAIQDRMARRQRGGPGRSSMVCPAAVRETWLDESIRTGAHLDVHAHSMLSHPTAREHERTVEALRRTQLLCVDESHNFLNLASNRTAHLLRNLADHVVLFTATPINRSTQDLLRTADLLGADNLSERTVAAFERLLGRGRIDRGLTGEEVAELRAEIQQFTVRRTKRMINAIVAEQPEAYATPDGGRHGFPRHDSHVYALDEPGDDRRLAREIRELAGRLAAVHHFRRPLELPGSLEKRGWTPQQYLERRLLGAQRLARYAVMAALRSSRAALVDHLVGTAAAAGEFGLEGFARGVGTGDILGRLERIGGQPPANRLGIALPDWLADADAPCRRLRARPRDLRRHPRARARDEPGARAGQGRLPGRAGPAPPADARLRPPPDHARAAAPDDRRARRRAADRARHRRPARARRARRGRARVRARGRRRGPRHRAVLRQHGRGGEPAARLGAGAPRPAQRRAHSRAARRARRPHGQPPRGDRDLVAARRARVRADLRTTAWSSATTRSSRCSARTSRCPTRSTPARSSASTPTTSSPSTSPGAASAGTASTTPSRPCAR